MPSLESASQRAARSWHMGDPVKNQISKAGLRHVFLFGLNIKIFTRTRGTFLSTAEGGTGGGLDAILFCC